MCTAQDFNKKVGARIKKIRKEKNIKQEWLALKVGLGKSEISRLENGKRAISLPILFGIASTLNTSPDYFLQEFHDL